MCTPATSAPSWTSGRSYRAITPALVRRASMIGCVTKPPTKARSAARRQPNAIEREPSPSDKPGNMTMSTITAKDGTEIYYKDWGPKGAQPIVFHHGWPLSADDWDTQMLYFLSKGYRVIAHDRRGHGRSSQVADNHDMDHY